MSIGEEEYITRAAHGDQEAFRHLWDAHHAIAMAVALRLCQQRSLAEEVTQGAFLLAWRGLPQFQPGRPFRPWLLRILYRHALDVLERQRAYLHPLSLDEIVESEREFADNHCIDPQEQVARREEVRQMLAQLSADQRRVIALRYGADLPFSEIAQVLGWPIGTVKSRLNRAHARCRELLQDEMKGSQR